MEEVWGGGGYGVVYQFKQYFSYFLEASFIGGGNRSTQRKPPTYRKSVTNFLSHNVASSTLHNERDSNSKL